jgi:AraC-like DNA-binding protein
MQTAKHVRNPLLFEDFDEWMDWSSSHYSKSNPMHRSSARFAAEVSAWTYGPVELSKTSFLADGTASYLRGGPEIRQDPRDHFELLAVVHGTVDLEQGGRRSALGDGDCVLYDQARPFSLRFQGQCEAIFMNIPCARVLRRLPDATHLTALRVGGDSKLGCFVGALLRDLVNLDMDAKTAQRAGLGHSMADTVLASMEAELGGRIGDVTGDARMLVQTKKFILAHLCDPELAIDEVAKAQEISRSTLNRLFASEATTPMKWVWTQRLAACHEALAAGGVKQITALAFDHGFNDLSHFSRSFKKMYGRSPRSLLHP